MPYKRYDITNTYSYRGRRKNENTVVKTIFLIILPFIIIGVLLGGAYVSYLLVIDDRPINTVTPVATEDAPKTDDERLLVVVNESAQLEPDYVPELEVVNGVEVSVLVTDDLNDMIKAAEKDGVNIELTAGYVTYDDQQKLYEATFNKLKKKGNLSQIKAEAETKKVCPPAGCSESQTGLLIKFNSPENSEAYKWLVKYSVNYGFILRYPEAKENETGMKCNPFYFRFVGKESAANIRRYDMCLEEYATHISIR